MMISREQVYAAAIYEQVKAIADAYPDEDDKRRKQYGAMAHKLPILVRQAGLVQALAFVESRGKDPHKQLLAHLAKTIGESNADQFLNRSRTANLQNYMLLTEKTLLALKWYKRFAQSVLKVKPTDEDDVGED